MSMMHPQAERYRRPFCLIHGTGDRGVPNILKRLLRDICIQTSKMIGGGDLRNCEVPDTDFRADLDFDAASDWFDPLAADEQTRIKGKSWELIFEKASYNSISMKTAMPEKPRLYIQEKYRIILSP